MPKIAGYCYLLPVLKRNIVIVNPAFILCSFCGYFYCLLFLLCVYAYFISVKHIKLSLCAIQLNMPLFCT